MLKGMHYKVLFLSLFVCCLFSCGTTASKYVNGDIVVLWTSDVHCVLDNDIGYAGLAKYKSTIEETNPNVTLIDLGDAITGDSVGSVSNGEYVIDVMNQVGYDYSLIGSHDYDYGMTALTSLMNKAHFKYLGCNIDFIGTPPEDKNGLSKMLQYDIVKYGNTSVAFIGLSTNKDILKSTPRYFMNSKGRVIYSFLQGQNLYQRVQKCVDECKAKGAKFVVLVSALGIDDDGVPNRAYDVIHNTTGVDVVIDGRSHKEIESENVFNKDGGKVLYSQAGTGFSAIGRLNISPSSGRISTQLVKSVRGSKDFKTLSVIRDIKANYEKDMKRVVGKSEINMITRDSSGKRIVRNRETPIGNFCADAYRAISGADIAFVNGGGIRSDIKKGDLTRDDIKKIHPYGNKLCVVETTGQSILDALELSASSISIDYTGITGDNGGFLQVSGLNYSIDTSVPTSVVLDKSGYFVSVSGDRRVYDVAVYNKRTGDWEYIEPDKHYTLVSTNYMLKDAGDGYNMFRKANMVLDEFTEDSQALSTYILGFLNGVITEADYGEPQGRITIE